MWGAQATRLLAWPPINLPPLPNSALWVGLACARRHGNGNGANPISGRARRSEGTSGGPRTQLPGARVGRGGGGFGRVGSEASEATRHRVLANPQDSALGSPAEGRPPRSPSYKVNTDTLRKPCKTPSLASSETQAPPARRGGCQLGPGTLRNRRVLPRAETASPAGWALQSPGAAGPQSPRALRPVQLSGLEEGPGHSSWLSAAPPALLERWAHLSQPVTKQEGT